jgi:aldehyde dehydrogenase
MTAEPSRSVSVSMLVAGRSVDREDSIEVRNPSDARELVGTVPRGSVGDVDGAVTAAASAFPGWSRLPIAERARVLRDAAEALRPNAEARGRLLARETGHPLADAIGGMARLSDILEWYAGVGDTFPEFLDLPSPNGRVTVYRQPMGVATLIVPWNGPTALGFLGLAPILLAGNTVVVKPPTEAPLALIDALQTIAPLFPAGTINVVTGKAAEIGSALVTHPLVRKINFTGSTETGKAILREAAATVKRVTLELGGNDAAVVMADADLDHAVPELVSGVFGLSGQVCYNVKRLYVHRSIHGEFVDRFRTLVDGFVVGDALDPTVTMGPLINDRQHRWVVSLVDDARDAGASVSEVGHPLDESRWQHGHFMLPTVVTDLGHASRLMRCEQFGPVAPIVAYDTEDEAISMVNDSEYGLASSLWSRDEERMFALAQRIEAGTTFINVHRRGATGVDMPFGGFKESGIGRTHGVVALEEQLELHTISSRRPARSALRD